MLFTIVVLGVLLPLSAEPAVLGKVMMVENNCALERDGKLSALRSGQDLINGDRVVALESSGLSLRFLGSSLILHGTSSLRLHQVMFEGDIHSIVVFEGGRLSVLRSENSSDFSLRIGEWVVWPDRESKLFLARRFNEESDFSSLIATLGSAIVKNGDDKQIKFKKGYRVDLKGEQLEKEKLNPVEIQSIIKVYPELSE